MDDALPCSALWVHDGIVESTHILAKRADDTFWIGDLSPDGQLAPLRGDVPGRQLPIRGAGAEAVKPTITFPRHAIWQRGDANIPVIYYSQAVQYAGVDYVWIENLQKDNCFGVPQTDIDLRRPATRDEVQTLQQLRKGLSALSPQSNNTEATEQVYNCLLDNPALDQNVAQAYLDQLRPDGNVAVLEAIEGFYSNLVGSRERYLTSEPMKGLFASVKQYVETASAEPWTLPTTDQLQLAAFDGAIRGLRDRIAAAWDDHDIDLKLAIAHYGRLLQSDPAYAGTAMFRKELKAFERDEGALPKPLKIAAIIDCAFELFADMYPRNCAYFVRRYGGQHRILPIV